MKNSLRRLALIPLCVFTLTSCAGSGMSSTIARVVTVANVLGTWIASSENPEGITEFTLTEVNGVFDEVNIESVLFDDTTSDVGLIQFTDGSNINRGISVQLSSGTLTGTLALSDNCKTMNLTLEGESGTFRQDGNSCTDTTAFELEDSWE